MKVAIIAVAVILLLLILWYIVTYNGFVKLRNFVQESWRQIDVELKRRRDLIPNLVETVRGYMAHEQMTLQAVVEARRSEVAERIGPVGRAFAAFCRCRKLPDAARRHELPQSPTGVDQHRGSHRRGPPFLQLERA